MIRQKHIEFKVYYLQLNDDNGDIVISVFNMKKTLCEEEIIDLIKNLNNVKTICIFLVIQSMLQQFFLNIIRRISKKINKKKNDKEQIKAVDDICSAIKEVH